eukprot:6197974-Pleurochrysis_carterae.AAC.1
MQQVLIDRRGAMLGLGLGATTLCRLALCRLALPPRSARVCFSSGSHMPPQPMSKCRVGLPRSEMYTVGRRHVRSPRAGQRSSGVRMASSWITEPSITPTLVTIAAVGAYKVYEKRPRGWLEPSIELEAGPSTVPGAGRGVFTKTELPPGCVIGSYPGRLRTQAEYQYKLSQFPETSSYCWTMPTGFVLDPTNGTGILCEPLRLVDGLPLDFGSVQTTLALINEPPVGRDTNLEIDEVACPGEVLFLTWRGVMAGEELFIDYGQNYDRSSYVQTTLEQALPR